MKTIVYLNRQVVLKVLLMGLFILIPSVFFAQKTITGTVSNETGPLPGVNIIVKGTKIGTETDFDGKYSIVAKQGDVLVFTYVGMEVVEKKVGASAIIDVVMTSSSAVLDEVVVTAFGTKAKGITLRSCSIPDGSYIKKPQSGLLTAGEINDLDNWQKWLKIRNWNTDFIETRNNWQLYLEDKMEVSVESKNGFPIVNARVKLLSGNNIIDQGMTDVKGRIFLFREKNKNQPYAIQVLYANQVKGVGITNFTKEINFIFESEEPNNEIDIMFTIDATGSMGDEINYLKSEIENIITRIDSSFHQKKIGLTFYRDQGDEYVVRDFDFSTDIASIKQNLSNQYAAGGGDFEEAVEEALKISLSKSWNENAKTKLLFLLLDAPPHLNQDNVFAMNEQLKKAKKMGIKIIPIVASGADKNLEFLMRYLSIISNGTYVFLTDDSGKGNPHLKPTTNDYKVEKLVDLIVRLIDTYSHA